MPFINVSTLAYPATSSLPVQTWQDTRDPTINDFRNFQIGNTWVNTSNQSVWFMVDKTGTTGVWVQGASSGTGILTITGDVGGAVGADGANNINLLSGGNITVTGNPGTNTLTISLDVTVASTYTADVGSAMPAANNINIFGTNGISTSAAGSTVTVTAGGTIPTTFTEDAGSATPAANNLNIVGGSGITTAGAGDTVTITADAAVPLTFTEDAGFAVPAANNLNIIGAGSISTSGAGSTVTITGTGGGLGWQEITVVGPTATSVNMGYITNNVARVELTLPLLSVLGANIRVVGKGAGGWQINQNAGQNIVLDAASTTVGVGGNLQSDAFGESIDLICTTADTTWTIADGIGNYIFN